MFCLKNASKWGIAWWAIEGEGWECSVFWLTWLPAALNRTHRHPEGCRTIATLAPLPQRKAVMRLNISPYLLHGRKERKVLWKKQEALSGSFKPMACEMQTQTLYGGAPETELILYSTASTCCQHKSKLSRYQCRIQIQMQCKVLA